MTDKERLADGSPPGALAGATAAQQQAAVASLKLKAQELGRAGNAQAAEAILGRVLELQPDDAEALALQAIIDSENGRHALAVRRGLRAAQLTRWRSPPICENLALFIRRLSNERERARVLRKSLPVRALQARRRVLASCRASHMTWWSCAPVRRPKHPASKMPSYGNGPEPDES